MTKVPNKTKRAQKRKARRLAAAEAQRKLAREPAQRECHVTATRQGDMILFQTRTGYFSPRTGPVFAIYDIEIADACDNPNALVELCMKAGLSTLSALLRTPVLGVPGQEALKRLAEAAAKWMKLDLDELRKVLEAERAAEARVDTEAQAAMGEGRLGEGPDPMIDLGGEG